MTQSTEQERTEFEAAYVAEKLRILDSEGSAASGDYDNSFEAHFSWWAWQAARCAPVVPPTVAQVEEAVGMGATAWDCIAPQSIIDAVLALAAAPQPPACNPSMQPKTIFPTPGKWLHKVVTKQA